MIAGCCAEYLLADRGDDPDASMQPVNGLGQEAVSPPRKNRKEQRDDDQALSTVQQLVEHAVLYRKRWRGIATRYAEKAAFLFAAIQI